ncbi:lytic transglycosylase domain-containing protein [Salinarimonas rosea]|uniref:lytic transglycosylase domain-containing protein n=1 Tax=Salinarimonas rosea TaxID=552063 RepID=UPI0012EC041F|nr:lytic transglycosylase domain-containing protein [Salinarimonas rosea]
MMQPRPEPRPSAATGPEDPRRAMFLFTSLPAQTSPSATAVPPPVVDAIRDGARASGLSFDYLLATAQRESALDPSAQASTSSATGLFQFIEQTWLGLVDSEGPRLGLAEEARAVVRGADGRYHVPDPAQRAEILALREDPRLAAQLAGALTNRNAAALESALGGAPSEADLAVAHVLGATGAATLIRAAGERPQTPAETLFPRAAEANPALFRDGAGAPRSAAALYRTIADAHEAARTHAATAGTAPAPDGAAPAFGADAPLAFARRDGPAFHGLFRTDGAAPGPVSGAVASLWSAPPDGALPTPAAAPAPPVAPSTAPIRGAAGRVEGPLDLAAVARGAR